MDYVALAGYFSRLEATSKRLEMTAILTDMLAAFDAAEVEPALRLLQGKVRPDWEGIELGMAEKLVIKAIENASGIGNATKLYHDQGDLGLAAEAALQQSGAKKQATLFGPQSMSVAETYDAFLAIAAEQGHGSQDRKEKRLHKLLLDASPLEARYMVRAVAGRLRLGVADMTILDSLANWHLGKGVRSVQEMEPDERAEHEDVRRRLERAYDVTSDLPLVAATLAARDMSGVDALHITVGTPLRPMAAERLKTLGEILEKQGGRVALEYKYDGLRVQAHVPASADEPVRLFSRRMEELTGQFPDVCAALRSAMKGMDCIVEGECVAVDAAGRMRPFQEVSRRRGRKTGLGEETRKESALAEGGQAAGTIMDEVPVAMFLFDCLAAGESTMPEAYLERRDRLGQLFSFNDQVRLSEMETCTDEAGMEAFFARAVADGAEGIMCKAPDAPYKAGNRGFDWIKFKTDYTEELVDTLDLAVIGAFYGRGRRAGWYGALLMAAHDSETGKFTSLCKLGTGFDDETLKGLRERFEPHVSPTRPSLVESTMEPDVWIEPVVVMEVQAAELTLSPVHRAGWNRIRPDSGLALRFPRFTGRWRDDKTAEQATSVDEVQRLYDEQGH